jgi:hypothetical protein
MHWQGDAREAPPGRISIWGPAGVPDLVVHRIKLARDWLSDGTNSLVHDVCAQ